MGLMSKQETRGAPLVDGEGMAAILMTQGSVNLGPGKPGPGDEWKFPTEPSDADAGTSEEIEPAPTRPGLLSRLLRRD
jgi:hypothetical protein